MYVHVSLLLSDSEVYMQPHDAPALLAAARQQLQYTLRPPGGDITGGF